MNIHEGRVKRGFCVFAISTKIACTDIFVVKHTQSTMRNFLYWSKCMFKGLMLVFPVHFSRIFSPSANSAYSEMGFLFLVLLLCLFVLILYVPPTIFQLNRDGSSWVEP